MVSCSWSLLALMLALATAAPPQVKALFNSSARLHCQPPLGFVDEYTASVHEVTAMKFLDSNRIIFGTLAAVVAVAVGVGGVMGVPHHRLAPMLMPALICTRQRVGTLVIGDVSQTPMPRATYMSIPNVDSGYERGLLSFALDPDFPNQPYLYILYSHAQDKRYRLSRFTHEENGGLDARGSTASEVILWEDPDIAYNANGDLDWPAPFHYGGEVVFDNDGYIYLTLGDKYNEYLVQQPHTAAGKVIRINKDGSFPSSNMGVQTAGMYDGVYAVGIRNGYRAFFDSPTERFFVSEVGSNDWNVAMEDVHIIQANKNYGWPMCEGACDNPDFAQSCDCSLHESAIYSYAHYGDEACIIGGFVNWANQFPQEYQGAYFFADYAQGWMKYLTFDPPTSTNVKEVVLFNSDTGTVIDIEQAPDGSFYYATLNDIRHVFYELGNHAPVVHSVSSTDPTSKHEPLEVQFSVDASDADGDALAYTWYFGDGTTSSEQNPSKLYSETGQFRAFVVVSDGDASTTSEFIDIRVGKLPKVKLRKPDDGYLFKAGEKIKFVCRGKKGGEKIGSKKHSWEVVMVHGDHTHPAATDDDRKVKIFIPETGHGFSTEVYYRATCSVNDNGLVATNTLNIYPDEVDITLATSPPGMVVALDGGPKSTPYTFDQVKLFKHTLLAEPARCLNDVMYTFQGWADGVNTAERNIVVPDNDITYTALYAAGESCTSGKSCMNTCNIYVESDACQCDAACSSYGDCCYDYDTWCSSTSRRRSISAVSMAERHAYAGKIEQPVTERGDI
ncbi:uncharacterized protein MONBRDRAFT_21995 [Monosiga brevicollis MX1]|uniref:PKD domain-containing protein n=1 Tax=Monosiga brevicollis TaxID=81824 RepID=A9UP82_MONBE|nr:uncharacterized protein MONBRDRAFT_21995 [Monosiga brevicollis MX1]EDQ92828.1 predicted protein [Monosiga brevicollis MX1]|eukprot:XP_001742590.1 hypothetical protein [Monosiga brevicollis MX1]